VLLLEPSVLSTEEGAGITVVAKGYRASGNAVGTTPLGRGDADCRVLRNFRCAPSRIDGLSVTGGDAGGGIYVNGWAHGLEISNNRVFGNAGPFSGGIRIGQPYLEGQAVTEDFDGLGYDEKVLVHNNAITNNGTVEGNAAAGATAAAAGGAGGGLSICAGSDGYRVTGNWVCGNYSSSDGGGIGHIGLSNNGLIQGNQILFNESYNQSGAQHGGGVVIEGEGAAGGTLTLGTGNVTVDQNLILGNFARAGSGGGLRLQSVNGGEIGTLGNRRHWSVAVTNNMIVNNVAAWAGAGISVADTLYSNVIGNTVASNDSTGIAGNLFDTMVGTTSTGPTTAVPNPAGISTEATSAALLAVAPGNAISDPHLVNNVVWHNRSFFFNMNAGLPTLSPSNNWADSVAATKPTLALPGTDGCASSDVYWDIGVVGNTSANTVAAVATTLNVSTATQAGVNGVRTVTITTAGPLGMPVGTSFNVTITGVTGNNSARYNVIAGSATVTGASTFTYRPTNGGVSNANFTSNLGFGAANAAFTPAAGLVLPPGNSVLSTTAGTPALLHPYCNASRALPGLQFEPGTPFQPAFSISVSATLDESGNFVDLHFGPLSLLDQATGTAVNGDYHLQPTATFATSSTVDHGTDLAQASPVNHDYDGDGRPGGAHFDIGADELVVTTDLSITKTDGLTTVNRGQTVVYTIVVTNNGAAAVNGATVNDPALAGQLVAPVSWTCAPGTAGSSCPASGTGPISNVAVALAAGDHVTFLLTATVTNSAQLAANCSYVSNTASVTPPQGTADTAPGNNIATDSDQITCPTADLVITKTTSTPTVVANGTVVYSVTVTNAGPGESIGARVTDAIPGAYTQVANGWNWTCSANPIALCGTGANTGTGNINKVLGTLPAGATVNFVITATVRDNNAVGTLITNTATVTPAVPATDPNPGNNTASVTVRVVAGTGGVADSVAPATIAFGTVARGGASAVRNVTVTNTGTAPLVLAGFALSGTGAAQYSAVAPSTGTACVAGTTVLAATNAACTIGLRFTPAAGTATGAKAGTLTVTSNATAKLVTLTGTAN
jgi:uncharacterized repeat protein (TIGR01451 family)